LGQLQEAIETMTEQLAGKVRAWRILMALDLLRYARFQWALNSIPGQVVRRSVPAICMQQASVVQSLICHAL
jgi:hypothetical protein